MPIMQALGMRGRFAFGAVKQNRTFGQNALHQGGKRLAVSLAGRLSGEERFAVKSGIYQIENQVNGKRYIGSAVNLKKRWRNHLSDLRHNLHHNCHLQRALDKYGESVFVFTALEHIEEVTQLVLREQYYLDMLKPEYNIEPRAGSSLGCRRSLETRRKLSAAWTAERKRAHSDRQRGKPLSEETKRKLSAANMGKQLSTETRRKISEAGKGRYHSEAARRKMSETKRGNRHPMYGKHLTEEHRRKISEANKGRHLSKETRKKISEARKAYWRRVHLAKSQGGGNV